jgi:N6-L-threonylcarbamoyladenine synthase
MKILGIETSCDETSAAIIEDGRKILSLKISSSLALHRKTGGIIPENAAREQLKYILPVITDAIGIKKDFKEFIEKNIDAIAVTIGPGLIGSLLVGIETAKTISLICNKPIIPVNHIFAHIYANWLNTEIEPMFPAIALVVSGGHTELFLLKNHEHMKWLGGTRDDAAGEAFDKTARLLGLSYPGGPAIAAAAAQYPITNNLSPIKLPRPMIGSGTLEFSFSGLKTAVMKEKNRLLTMKSRQSRDPAEAGQLSNEEITYLAYEIQESIIDVLVKKTLMAAELHNVKSILLGGGVAANKRLNEKMKLDIGNLKLDIGIFIPPPYLCTDNAAYIASYAFFHNKPAPWKDISAQPNLEVEI